MKHLWAAPAAIALLCLTPQIAAAQDAMEKSNGLKKCEARQRELEKLNIVEKADPEKPAATEPFGGLDWGVGVSLTLDNGSRDRIATAEVVNNVVRVTDQNNAVARLMLESHYFMTPDGPFPLIGGACNTLDQKNWGIGPFVALQSGKEDFIDAIGFGLMVGFKREGITGSSFNIGIGAVVDPNTKVLGEGIKADQPLPAGEDPDVVRLQEREQWGLVLITSFTF